MATAKATVPRRLFRRRNIHVFPITFAALGTCALLLIAFPGFAGAQDFVSPTRIAHGPSGEISVSDASQQVVVSWQPGGKKGPKTISVPGRPVSVAYGWNKYYVGNESTQTVDVVNKKGRLLFTLGNDFLIQRPSDIAVDIDQEMVFVTDPTNARVLVFHRGGELLNTLPAAGQPPLFMPTGIAVDPVRGEVLVSDFGEPLNNTFGSAKSAVKIYNYDGVQLASISGKSGGGYNFSRPQGLAVNEQGHIYVVDSVRGQVLVFDRNTQQGVTIIGSLGPGPGQLQLPLDIIIDGASKDLHVTSNRNRRIEVFNGMGMLP